MLSSDLAEAPTVELFRAGLRAQTAEERERVLQMLTERATPEVLDAAVGATRSPEAAEREFAADVLGELPRKREFHEGAVRALLEICDKEDVGDVLVAAISGLGNRGDDGALETILVLRRHPEPQVRWAVAAALPLLAKEGRSLERATAALIQLTRDEDADVRDVATYGLGTQLRHAGWERGEPQAVGRALLERVDDEDLDTRSEALLGLAYRGDDRAVEPLLKALGEDVVGSLAVEAAAELGDPRLLPALHELTEWWDADQALLDRAVERCSGAASSEEAQPSP